MQTEDLPQFVREWREDEDSEDELLVTGKSVTDVKALQFMYACYCEAIAIKERHGIPVVGVSIDRRCTEHVVARGPPLAYSAGRRPPSLYVTGGSATTFCVQGKAKSKRSRSLWKPGKR